MFSVRHLVLDEADRLLDTEFVEQVQEIFAACSHKKLQTAVFSATLPAAVEEMSMDMMKDPIRIVVGLKWVSHGRLIHRLLLTVTLAEIRHFL